MSNKYFSFPTSTYKTIYFTLLFLQLIIWAIPAQALVKFNDLRDMWLNERYAEVLPLLLEADKKHGIELEYMIGTSACRIKDEQTQELGLDLLEKILTDHYLSITEHNRIEAEIEQCGKIITFLYRAEKKVVFFYRQEVVSDALVAQSQGNATNNTNDDTSAGVGISTNGSNVKTRDSSSVYSSSSRRKSTESSQETYSSSSQQIQMAIKRQIQRRIVTNGKLSNIQIKGNNSLKKCPSCVKPKTWMKRDSFQNKPNINNEIESDIDITAQPEISKEVAPENKIGTRPIISKRIATGSNIVTPKITSLPKVTGSKVELLKPITPRTKEPRKTTSRVVTPRRTAPTAAAPRRPTSRVVTPRRTAPTTAAPRKTTSRVVAPRRTTPTAAAPRKTTSRVVVPRRTAPTAAASRRPTSRVVTPRRTAPTTAAPRKTTSRVVVPRRTAPTAAAPRKTTSKITTLRKTRPRIAP